MSNYRSLLPLFYILFLTNTAFAVAGDFLKTYHLQLAPQSRLTLVKNDLKTSDNKVIHQLSYKSDENHIELKIFGPLPSVQAEDLIRLEYSTFQKLYSSAVTPYFGAVTNKKTCPPNFMPKEEPLSLFKGQTKVIFAKANPRNSFGICSEEDSHFDGAFLATYLPSGYFLKISAFAIQEKKDKIGTVKLKTLLRQFSYQQ